MDQFSNLGAVQSVTQFWKSLTGAQKLMTAIFAAASIALLGVVSIVATRPNMEVLFSGLQAEDAGAIVAKLQERKIDYDLDGGGSVVRVPSRNVHELRLQMASDGLPQGGTVGFEIFDKTNLGMTEFTQRLQYQRALQGELARTINQIDRVQQARVHIAIPERSLFDKGEKHPEASVFVKLKPGGGLGSDQVAGIVHLVSSAVQGMKPNHVTVVDTNGNVLSEANSDGNPFDARLSATQMEVKQKYEKQTQTNIESMLERVLGPNKAIVRVSARMNFDQREVSSETFEPVKSGVVQQGSADETGQPVDGYRGVLLSEQRMTETYGSGSEAMSVGGARGIAGVESNTSPGTATISELDGGYRREEMTSRYEVSKTKEHVVQTPGYVEQLSVAVMLDGKVDAGKVAAIQRVVEASAGIDAERGDKVIVERVPFDDTVAVEQQKEMQAAASKETYLSVGKTVGGIILLLGILFFMRGMLRQIMGGAPQQKSGQRLPPDMPSVSAPVTYTASNAGLVGAGVVAQSPPSGVTEQSPEEVAKVVREWISN